MPLHHYQYMAFKIISVNGLSLNGTFIPYELQEEIANHFLPNIFRDVFDDTMATLRVELATGAAAPINNIEKTMAQIAHDKIIDIRNSGCSTWNFNQRLGRFLTAVYSHSTTKINHDDRDVVSWWYSHPDSNPHPFISTMNYQDMLAFLYYINDDKPMTNPRLFTDSWAVRGFEYMDTLPYYQTHPWYTSLHQHYPPFSTSI